MLIDRHRPPYKTAGVVFLVIATVVAAFIYMAFRGDLTETSGRTIDTGQLLDSFQEIRNELPFRDRRGISRTRQDDVRRDDPGRPVSGIDLDQTDEAAYQKPRTDEQHEGEGNLRHDHRI